MSTPNQPVTPSPLAKGEAPRRTEKAKDKTARVEVVDPATGSPTIKFTAAPNPKGKLSPRAFAPITAGVQWPGLVPQDAFRGELHVT
jgi:hypothetical protein